MGARDGNYSRFQFDELKRYVGILVQQDKPLVDSDFNDFVESIIAQNRRLVQRVVGDVRVEGAWEASTSVTPNDFTVGGGDGTIEGAGRMWIGGLPVLLLSDKQFVDASVAEPNIHSRSTTLDAQLLTDSAAQWPVNELAGRELIPDVVDGTSFTVLSNTATTITTDPADGDMRAVAQTGDRYRVALSTFSGAYNLTGLSVPSLHAAGVTTITDTANLQTSGANDFTGGLFKVNGETYLITGHDDITGTIDLLRGLDNDIDTPDTYDLIDVREDAVYVDVYLDEVDPTQDASLFHDLSGTQVEGARRLQVVQTMFIDEGDDGTARIPDRYTDANGNEHVAVVVSRFRREDAATIIPDTHIDNGSGFSLDAGGGAGTTLPPSADIAALIQEVIDARLTKVDLKTLFTDKVFDATGGIALTLADLADISTVTIAAALENAPSTPTGANPFITLAEQIVLQAAITLNTTHRTTVSGNPHDVTPAELGLDAALKFKGGITLPADFPTVAVVLAGDFFTILADVTDNDVTKTNTGQSFSEGDSVAWDGTSAWVVTGDILHAGDHLQAGDDPIQIASNSQEGLMSSADHQLLPTSDEKAAMGAAASPTAGNAFATIADLAESGMFGNGADGAAVFNGVATPPGANKTANTYTLTRDVHYTTINVNAGIDVETAGFKVFHTGKCDLHGQFRHIGTDATDGPGSETGLLPGTMQGSGGSADNVVGGTGFKGGEGGFGGETNPLDTGGHNGRVGTRTPGGSVDEREQSPSIYELLDGHVLGGGAGGGSGNYESAKVARNGHGGVGGGPILISGLELEVFADAITLLTSGVATTAATVASPLTVDVTSTANFPDTGAFLLDDGVSTEWFIYNSKTATSFNVIRRNTGKTSDTTTFGSGPVPGGSTGETAIAFSISDSVSSPSFLARGGYGGGCINTGDGWAGSGGGGGGGFALAITANGNFTNHFSDAGGDTNRAFGVRGGHGGFPQAGGGSFGNPGNGGTAQVFELSGNLFRLTKVFELIEASAPFA